MRTVTSLLFALLLTLLPLSNSQADLIFTQVNLGDYNDDYITNPTGIFIGAHAQFPTGDVTLGDVPFAIPANGNNIWSAQIDNDHTLDIANLSINNALQVHVLVNTLWGSGDPLEGATLRVFGSGGAVAEATLVGDEDMRDYLLGSYTNSINGTTTTEVFTAGDGGNEQVRLDKFRFDLPISFQTQQLSRIELVDNGGENISRVFITGITVQSVPEPSSACCVGLAWLCVVCSRRKRSCI